MKRTDMKKVAISLRKQGKTYREINSSLGEKIPKSTLSFWLSKIRLKKVQKERIIKLQERLPDFIPDSDEFIVNKLFSSDCMRGIVKPDVQPVFYLTKKSRASLVGPAANRYHIVPLFTQIHIYRIRSVVTDVDSNLPHHLHSFGI